MTLARDGFDKALNRFEGTISQRVFLGDLTEYGVRTAAFEWRVQVLSSQPVLAVGDNVWITFGRDAATVVLNT
jgi:hypothetical protein